MSVYYDLHIYFILSPCADDLMTSNHIVLMRNLKQLDIIALTDHNSMKNWRVVSKVDEEVGVLFIPGIAVEIIEGVYLLSYFKSLEIAEYFGILIESHLNLIQNNEELFRHQWGINHQNEVIESFHGYWFN